MLSFMQLYYRFSFRRVFFIEIHTTEYLYIISHIFAYVRKETTLPWRKNLPFEKSSVIAWTVKTMYFYFIVYLDFR